MWLPRRSRAFNVSLDALLGEGTCYEVLSSAVAAAGGGGQKRKSPLSSYSYSVAGADVSWFTSSTILRTSTDWEG